MIDVDWSVFERLSESTCYCRCGAVFRSHAKCLYRPKLITVTRKPCPACGWFADCYRISSDPEAVVLSGPGEEDET